MAHPKLPYWFHAGRVSTPISGPVYVLKGDDVVEIKDSTVLEPRMRFFAPANNVSLLVSRGLVKRLKQPVEAEPKVEPKKEVAPVAPVATKSEAEAAAPESSAADSAGAEPTPDLSPSSGGSDTASGGDVVASDAGDGEAGKSVPEEKETAKSGRRRSRRS